MKKTYQIPEMITMEVAQSRPIAESTPAVTIGSSRQSEFDVKQQQRNDYNVWGDDWNK